MNVESSTSNDEHSGGGGRAVFLSYASQDAAAARCICDTLRSAGVEVWFDADGGLEHGDEWDAKIRRQIKECVLFIAVISANTQARHEGYFRIEWDLAAERARGIASGVPFILPVVIDETGQSEALVPDRFRTVQWTRLPAGVVSPPVQQRLLNLWSHRTGALSADAMRKVNAVASAPEIAMTGETPRSSRRLIRTSFAAAAVVAGAAFFTWWKISPPETAARASLATPAVGAPREADQLVTRATTILDKANYTRDELAAADALSRRAADLAPESADAWAARASVHVAYVTHGWDRWENRGPEIEMFARRALALDAKQGRALRALAQLHIAQQAYAQAEAIARRAIEVDSAHPQPWRVLVSALEGQGRKGDAAALRQEIGQRLPPDQHSGAARRILEAGDFAAALERVDIELARERSPGRLLSKVRLLMAWRGDVAGARAVLEQLTAEERTEIRAVGLAMWLGLLERRLDRVQAGAALTTQTYFTDFVLTADGPKAMTLALAFHVAGKQTLAQQQWQAAETAARGKLRDHPGDLRAAANLAIALVWLGRTEDAAREISVCEATVLEQITEGNINNHTVHLARYYASLGNAAKAVTFLRRAEASPPAAGFPISIEITAPLLSLDPWWDKIREQPEFIAFLAEAKSRLSGPKTEQPGATPEQKSAMADKSVAVLAFANLSDDKENEYFSDGISEELLNVLAKVPGLRVAARTSAFYFKGKNVTAQEIGQKLGVAHLVEGSVRRDGTNVRVMARLSRADTGEQVWSDKFDGELKSIFGLQDEIAGKIAENLKLRLGGSRAAKEVNPEAHRLVLEGRFFWNLRTEDGFARAEASFRKALEIDPAFAPAHAGLAELHSIRPIYLQGALDVRHDWIRADEEIDRALALDPGLAEPHAARGFLRLGQGRIDEGIAAFERAFAANPALMVARLWHVQVAVQQGRLDRAIDQYRQYLEIDPFSVVGYDRLAHSLALAGRYEEALAALEHGLALRPEGIVWMRFNRAYILERLGRRNDALAAARATRRIVDQKVGLDFHPIAIAVLQRLGQADEARDYAADLESRLPPDSFIHGLVRVALGQRDEAFPRLNNLPPNLWSRLYWDVMFEPFRSDPRFEQLLVKLGCAKEYKVARETLARMQGEAEARK